MTRTVLFSGIVVMTPAGDGMTSNVNCIGWETRRAQSATTIVPGSIRCRSTASNVESKNRRSSCTVITAATDESTSCRCEYGLPLSRSVTIP